MSLQRIRSLIRKEFIQLLRDRGFIPLIFMAPLIQLTLFGYVAATNVEHVATAVYDADNTPESRDFLRHFSQTRYFDVREVVTSPAAFDALLDANRVKVALHIPEGFARALKRGETAQVQCLVDGTDSSSADIALSYVAAITRDASIKRANLPIVPGLDARWRVWYNEELDNVNFIVPGIICTILAIVTTVLTAMAIVKEREQGTIEQLIVSPLAPSELILGKVAPFLVIGFIDVLLILAVGIFWFRIPIHGSIPLLLLLALPFLMNTLGMGILISTLSRTQQQAMLSAFFLLFPWILLSGFIFPIENMPSVIQYVTYLIPLRYFLIIIRGIILKGVGMSVLWPHVLALLMLGSTVLLVSILRFHKRLE